MGDGQTPDAGTPAYTFGQVPQQLLAGDSSKVIKP